NAILPGVTNRLSDVAEALGYERTGPPLTGAAVARRYRRWMLERTAAAEPNWDRLESYCEDDVRALAQVYQALESAVDGRPHGNGRAGSIGPDETVQGTLGEY
ncbi:MAG: ribonuclease H-like domain-containing protein, partial [Halodesulfurarchaeum sp.]